MTLASDKTKTTLMTTDQTDQTDDQLTIQAQLFDYWLRGRLWAINTWDAYGNRLDPVISRLRATKALADGTDPSRLLLIAALLIIVALVITLVATVAPLLVFMTRLAAVAIAAMACARWTWMSWSWVDSQLPSKDIAD